jgi:hypothetical protein
VRSAGWRAGWRAGCAGTGAARGESGTAAGSAGRSGEDTARTRARRRAPARPRASAVPPCVADRGAPLSAPGDRPRGHHSPPRVNRGSRPTGTVCVARRVGRQGIRRRGVGANANRMAAGLPLLARKAASRAREAPTRSASTHRGCRGGDVASRPPSSAACARHRARACGATRRRNRVMARREAGAIIGRRRSGDDPVDRPRWRPESGPGAAPQRMPFDAGASCVRRRADRGGAR